MSKSPEKLFKLITAILIFQTCFFAKQALSQELSFNANRFYRIIESQIPVVAAIPLLARTVRGIDVLDENRAILDAAHPSALASVSGVNSDAGPAGAEAQPTAVDAAHMTTGVFDSVAIPFSKLKALEQWKGLVAAVEMADFDHCLSLPSCNVADTRIVRGIDAALSLELPEKLQMINTTVNRAIKYGSDLELYGRTDHWAEPAETVARGRGDCEDFAILKMAALHAAGVPIRSMSLVVLRDRKRNFFHAVLSVSTSEGDFILDILGDRVRRDDAFSDYQPLYSLSGMRAWIHGYQRNSGRFASGISGLQDAAPGTGPDWRADVNGAKPAAGS